MSRGRRKRQERKAAKSQHRDSVRSLEEERESLRLENERLADSSTPASTPTPPQGPQLPPGPPAPWEVPPRPTATTTAWTTAPSRATAASWTGSPAGTTARRRPTRPPTDHGSTVPTGTSSDDGYRSDRVIDHETDLREHDSTGQHRQV